jgi:hypothetical protein
MKCGEFAAIVHDLASQRELDPSLAAIAREHAQNCPSCGLRLAEAQNLAKLLQTASAEGRRLEAPPALETSLLNAFRRETAARGHAAGRGKFGWRLAAAWAGAGVVLAACVLVVLVSRAPDRGAPTAVRGSAAAPAATVVQAAANESAESPVPSSQSSLTSGFVPVPYAGSLGPGGAAVIVRVRLPRSSLAELGYPVNEIPSQGTVQADLVLGEDGWPRAVRIVQ